MADNEIVLRIVGDASQATAALDKVGKSSTSLTDKLRNATRGFMDIQAAMQIGMMAARALVRPLEDSVQAYTDLAAQVRDFTRTTGVSAEEASRMIEVMNDLIIPTATLKLAMREMVNNGMNPTMESLAVLADQYIAIKDPVERAAFAMDNFGARGGVEMSKALELGGNQLRAMNDAVGENQILDEKATKAARDFEIAQDSLNDSVEGLKIQIGKGLAPIITNIAKDLANLGKTDEQLAEEVRKTTKDIRDQAKSVEDYRIKLKAAYPELEQMRKAQGMLGVAAQGSADKFEEMAGATDVLDFAMLKIQDRIKGIEAGFQTGLRGGVPVVKELQTSFEEATPAIDNANLAMLALKSATDEYHTLLAGSWTTSQQNYKDKLAELKGEQQGIIDKMKILLATPNISEEQKAQLEAYKIQLQGVGTEIQNIATEQATANKKMMLGWIEMGLAADGALTAEDIGALSKIAKDWGLISAQEEAALLKAQQYVQWVNANPANPYNAAPATGGGGGGGAGGAFFGGGAGPTPSGGAGYNITFNNFSPSQAVQTVSQLMAMD